MTSLKFPVWFIAIAIGLSAAFHLQAAIRLPAVFGSNMVLQQGIAVPVWGWADDGEVMTVEFGGQKVSTMTKNGKWSLKLGQLAASSQPQTFTVSTKTETCQFTNVLVGEVWVCSGQSNMKYPLVGSLEAKNDVAAATNSLIHFFDIPIVLTNAPQSDVKAIWKSCSPNVAAKISAVGYYFVRDVQTARQVPVGLIESAKGDTLAESWMRSEIISSNPRYAQEILIPEAADLKNYSTLLANYQKKKSQAEQSGGKFTQPAPVKPRLVGELYNGMIAPLIPYAIKGVIWYQGEANANAGRSQQYRTLFPDLIRNWRNDWAQGDFTFLCVQLAPFDNFRKRTLADTLQQPEEGTWAELREAQLLATQVLPKVGLAVITDVGEKDAIHPKKKEPVGARLALAARALAYGEKLEFSGPIFRSMKVADGKMILSFDHVGKGLEARDGGLKGFSICGSDKKFVWAKAEIAGDTVVVSSPEVPAPIAVRYGWADFPVVNLWNKDGLPASPFRTDDPARAADKPDRSALDVTQFGAIPDDGKDDTAAFLAAFRALKTNDTQVIEIPRGIYHLRADGNPMNPRTLFPVSDLQGLTIRGHGAELMMSGKGAVFSFSKCQNLTVEGLTVDWERPAFSQGTVIAASAKQFDVQIEPGFPVSGGEPIPAFMNYDPATRLPDGQWVDVYDGVEKTELLRPQVLRVFLKRSVPAVKVGTLLVLRHEVYGPGVFNLQRCAEVRLRDVTVYSASGMALHCFLSTNVSLNHFDVLLRPGSGRLMSTTADATHFGGCKGTVTLEDCTFEGMGDDGVNVKSGLYLKVKEQLDDHTVLCQHNLKMVDVPDAGDAMEISPPENLLAFATNRVQSAKLEPGADKIHRIIFSELLPATLRVGDLLGNASRVPKLRMSHCTVRANRARGILCNTRDAIIEDCTFNHCTGSGVMLITENVHFYESIAPGNVTVRHCRFENCNQGAASSSAALTAVVWLKDFAYPPGPGVIRDVRFEGNEIINTPRSAIFAVAVDGLTIRSNTIQNACMNPVKQKEPSAIQTLNCSREVISDNEVVVGGSAH